ncbi:MAG: methyltransferase domain-containing protein [Spirochaetes bacterium]|nr:methyltransferase domain-containing protein [Spirochaetota bacterium]
MTKQFHFTFKGFLKRLKQEYHYYTKRPWSLEEVGAFWDTVEDYDEINEQLYTYYLRFTNSYDLAIKYLPKNDYNMLDIQARSGKGSLFWYEKKKIKKSICVDFSPYLSSLADKRLKETDLDYDSIMIKDFPLPFDDHSFNLVCSYETIEHIYDYELFFDELVRVLHPDGIIILTCPNALWEIVHWIAAVININHSEGPHRFLKRSELMKCIKKHDLEILEENTTIISPFNNKILIRIDQFLHKFLPEFIKRHIALRRTFILKKINNKDI